MDRLLKKNRDNMTSKPKINNSRSPQEKFGAITTLRGFSKVLKKLDTFMVEDYVEVLKRVLLQFDSSYHVIWIYTNRDIYEVLCQHFELSPSKYMKHFMCVN